MSLCNLAGRFLRVLYHTRVVSDKRNKNEIIILLASTEATLLLIPNSHRPTQGDETVLSLRASSSGVTLALKFVHST